MITSMKMTVKKKSKLVVMREALDNSFAFVNDLRGREEGTSDTLIFYLPLSPVSLNSRLHWRTADAMKKRYHAHFEALCQKWNRMPDKPTEPWGKATLEATFHTRAPNDVDNLIGRAKISVDCLVRGGWLLNDSPKHLTWGAIPEQIVDRTAPAYLVIRLTRQEQTPEEIEAQKPKPKRRKKPTP